MFAGREVVLQLAQIVAAPRAVVLVHGARIGVTLGAHDEGAARRGDLRPSRALHEFMALAARDLFE